MVRKILISGASGFVGKNLVAYLRDNTEYELDVPSKKEFNLLEETPGSIEVKLFHGEYDVVIHLAGVVGGIGFNQNNQAKLGYENLQMGLNLLEGIKQCEKKPKLIMLGTTCSYPHSPKTIPFIEDELFDGMPELTNSGYGIVKRTLTKLAIEYSKQYELNITNLIPTNMYGPHDSFDESKSHVIPALIKKFEQPMMAASESLGCFTGFDDPVVEIWGDGTATRDFLYVEDCVRAIALTIDRNTGPQPINLGSGIEYSIKDLVEKIKQVGQYNAMIQWDTEKPNGQPRRCLDIRRAKEVLRWSPAVSLDKGLRKTIEWYRNE